MDSSVEHGERVEVELDRIVEKRRAQRVRDEGERDREELWQESVRRYNARQEQDHRTAWYEHEMRLYRIHSGLASEHLARAESLENGNHYQEEERKDAKTRAEDLEREYRRKVAGVRLDASLSWEKKERQVRELGLRYDQKRKEAEKRR